MSDYPILPREAAKDRTIRKLRRLLKHWLDARQRSRACGSDGAIYYPVEETKAVFAAKRTKKEV